MPKRLRTCQDQAVSFHDHGLSTSEASQRSLLPLGDSELEFQAVIKDSWICKDRPTDAQVFGELRGRWVICVLIEPFRLFSLRVVIVLRAQTGLREPQ